MVRLLKKHWQFTRDSPFGFPVLVSTKFIHPTLHVNPNLDNFLRRVGLPREVKEWSLRSLRVKLIKIGALPL